MQIHTVKASKPKRLRRFACLSYLDVVNNFNTFYIKYFFKNDSNAPDFMSFEKLINQLTLVLNEYEELSGSLEFDKSSSSVGIRYDNKGVLVSREDINVDFNELEKSSFSIQSISMGSEWNSRETSIDATDDISKRFLLELHFKYLAFNSGLVLVVGFNHSVIDGFGLFMFLKDWASSVKTGMVQNLNLRHTRTNFNRTHNSDTNDYHGLRLIQKNEAKNESTDSTLAYSQFFLSKSKIESLKRKIADEFGHDLYFSFIDYLSAVFLKSIAKMRIERREISITENFRIHIAVDIRKRTSQHLTDYFGNAFLHTALSSSAADLSNIDTCELMREFRAMLNNINHRSVEPLLSFIHKQRLKYAITYDIDFEKDVLVVDWSRFDVYNVNFGWERPQHLAITKYPFPSTCYILNGREEGSLCITFILHDKDQVFFKNEDIFQIISESADE